MKLKINDEQLQTLEKYQWMEEALKRFRYPILKKEGKGIIKSYLYHQYYLNPYINFHRPCLFPVEEIDHKRRIKKKYPYSKINTPFEKLKSIPNIESYLRPGVTLEKAQQYTDQMSDGRFAERMVKARSDLFLQTQRLIYSEAD